MNSMTYKRYAARIEYSADDDCFVGRIAGIRDVVGFHGASVSELREAFHDAVDDYLATCEKVGKAPQRPYSGKVVLRIEPELHKQAAIKAELEGKSLNKFLEEAVAERTWKNHGRFDPVAS